MKKIYLTVSGIFLSSQCLFGFPGKTGQGPGSAQSQFIENKGQVFNQFHQPRKDVLFGGSTGNLVYHLRQTGVSYQYVQEIQGTSGSFLNGIRANLPARQSSSLQIFRVDVDWLNCNPAAAVTKQGAAYDHINYYNVVCPDGVRTKSYEEVTYKELYSGIDLRWYYSDGQLKYDYLVAAGASYQQISLKFSGQEGLSLNRNGDLLIATPYGSLLEGVPLVYQEGKKLSARWTINTNTASFHIDGYDPSKPLLIDPIVRVWATYFGGVGTEYTGHGWADAQGNAYIVGQTSTPTNQNLATSGAHQVTYGGGPGGNAPGDAYLAKFNASGVRLWSTYYGGNGSDYGTAIVTDASQNCYMVGASLSSSAGVIATPGSYQPAYAGGVSVGDAMIVKFDATGARVWGTYYGDTHDDWANAVTIDASGTNIYLTGGTIDGTLTAFSTPGAHQPAHGTGTNNVDCYVAMFSTSGSRVWSTYYGGTGQELGNGCAADASGNVYVAGITSTTLMSVIATTGAHQTNYAGNTGPFTNGDAFLVKFDQAGARQWGTYYGGTADDYASSCAVDGTGDVYMGGNTASTGANIIATPGTAQPAFGGAYDAYLVKFNSAGTRLWGTYHGVNTVEDWSSCALDASGNVFITGQCGSNSSTVIATPCSYQIAAGGQVDAFIVKYGNTGQKLWSTYYGGTGIEEFNTIFCSGQSLYLTGTSTGSGTMITTPNAHQVNPIGTANESYLVKFDPCTNVQPAVSPQNVVCKGKPVNLTATNTCYLAWFVDQGGSFVLHTGPTFTSGPLQSDTTFYVADLSCGIPGPMAAVPVTLAPSPTITIFSDRPVICVGESTSLEAFGGVTYTWTSPAQTGSVLTVTPGTNTIFHVTGADINGCEGQSSYTIQVYQCPGVGEREAPGRITVSPQPASEQVFIQGQGDAVLELRSISGQKITDLKLSAENNYQITVEGLPSGVYLLSSPERAFVRKVIVLK